MLVQFFVRNLPCLPVDIHLRSEYLLYTLPLRLLLVLNLSSQQVIEAVEEMRNAGQESRLQNVDTFQDFLEIAPATPN